MPGRKGRRTTIERGIYEDARGIEVVARLGRHRKSKRFPASTKLPKMRAWRAQAIRELEADRQPTQDPRTLAGAIEVYLTNTGTTSAPVVASLRAWSALYGALPRRKITPALAQQAIERWTNEGYSPQSLYYRRLVLEKLWHALDGPSVSTPVDDITVARPKGRRPVWVSNDAILEVLMNLRRQEMAGRLRDAKTRARFLVLATTGQRPTQLKRAERGDVVLYREPRDGVYGLWLVRPAKGGEATPVYLNREMRAAWEAFIVACAWGAYNTRSFARTIRYAGWPVGVRPYNVRHATGLTLSEAGADLADIQSHLGHTDQSTTRAYYVPQLHSRLRMLSVKLEGRFDPEAQRAELDAGLRGADRGALAKSAKNGRDGEI